MTISTFYNNMKAHGNLAKIPRYGKSQTGVQCAYQRTKRVQAEQRNATYQDLKHAVREVGNVPNIATLFGIFHDDMRH